jgi:hypothetical protein
MHAKKRKMLAIAGALALLSGCIPPSVNPLYTDNDLVFDPLLVGVWIEEAPGQATDENWAFEKGAGKSYKLTVTEEHGEKGEFEAHLLKLKDYFFLDLQPSQVDLDRIQADMTAWALIRGHLILRVHELDSKLKLSPPDQDWLNEYLGKNPKALAHIDADVVKPIGPGEKTITITASTQDLQQFVLAHIGKNQLFGEEDDVVVAGRRPAGAR